MSASAEAIQTRKGNRWRVERREDIVFLRSPSAREPEPQDWRERLAATMESIHGVEALGGKRLRSNGFIASMGEFIIHPKGFHSVGAGHGSPDYRFAEEVDAVAGGVMAMRAAAFEAAGGADVLERALGAVELCLAARHAGGRCLVAADVSVTDETIPIPADDESARFGERWGFDWRAADLDAVRARYAGTGLLWNTRIWSPPMPFVKYASRGAIHWTNYRDVPPYRQRADHLARIVKDHTRRGGRVLDLGCGDGLFTHLFAMAGLDAIGIDIEEDAISIAREQTGLHRYAGELEESSRPRFAHACAATLPCDTGSIATVALFDVVEHLVNPVSVLREVDRVLEPQGNAVITTPAWQLGAWSDPVYHVCEFTLGELTGLVEAATNLRVAATGAVKGLYRDLIVIARKPG
jgi:2-polyprenyl-3-methyl-5-hydroxy-6-metoxy-1,4-benzoquinol methylase